MRSVGGGHAKVESVLNAFSDPATQLAQTLGQVQVTEDDNNIYVRDSYDFNNQGSILNFKHLLYKTGGDPYGMFRGMGSMSGSAPEYGRPVNIVIPKPKTSIEVGTPIAEILND